MDYYSLNRSPINTSDTLSQTVYILKGRRNQYYTGCTGNLVNRIKRHNLGMVNSTKHHRPLELVWYCVFQEKWKAYAFEKYLKSGSGIAFRNKRLI